MKQVYCIVLYCIVLYCIVLSLYTYIAFLAVHTNQKRFQCERPREESSLKRTKRDTWLPVNNEELVNAGCWHYVIAFHQIQLFCFASYV